MRFALPLLLGIALTTFLLVGCVAHPKENLPPAPAWQTTDDALRILRDRAATVKTVSATGDITLARPKGDSVRMDLAMVSASPDRLRLRAWKFGRAVFDLTLTPQGLWLVTPEDPSLNKARAGGLDAAKLARSWAMFSGQLFSHPDVAIRESASSLVVTAPGEEGTTITCTVDRRTLTPRTYEVKDPSRKTRFTLKLSAYQLLNGIPYAFRYDATSDSGTIRIDLRDVDLNTDLAPAAFTPPKRAEKVS
jgi:outer membrane lipoprotein-sorting protein